MDRKLILPSGVAIRSHKQRETLYISFQYRGIQCKEALKNLPVTKQNIKYASNLKAEIESKITRDTFLYSDYFYDSPKAIKFGHSVANVTTKALLNTWLNDIERSHPHSTYKCYRKDINSTLLPWLGEYCISDLALNPEPIREMIRHQKNTLKTIRNKLTPLRAVFDQAITDGLINNNPMINIKVSKLVDKKRSSKRKADPFNFTEINKILCAAKIYTPEWLPYFQFMFFTGLRPSEAYALTWADILWDMHQILINKAVVMREEKEAKTKSSDRTIDLLPIAEQALFHQKEITFKKNKHVFVNPKTGKAIRDYEETSKIFDYLQTKAGVRRRTQYQMRHSFASNLLSGGENIYYVATQMGHADIDMVMRVYGTWVEVGREKNKRIWVSDFGNFENVSELSQHVKNEDKDKQLKSL